MRSCCDDIVTQVGHCSGGSEAVDHVFLALRMPHEVCRAEHISATLNRSCGAREIELREQHRSQFLIQLDGVLAIPGLIELIFEHLICFERLTADTSSLGDWNGSVQTLEADADVGNAGEVNAIPDSIGKTLTCVGENLANES